MGAATTNGMTGNRESRAAQRAGRALPRDLPDRPSFPPGTACSGLAFVLRRAADPGLSMPDLAGLRSKVREIRRARIGEGAQERDLLVVLLVGPPAPHGLDHPAALPLIAVPGGLASHGSAAAREPAGAPALAEQVRFVDIWFAGTAHRVFLDLAERIALSTLWTMPEVTLHAAVAATAPPPEPESEAGRLAAPEGEAASLPVSVPLRTAPPLREDPFAELRDAMARPRTWHARLGGYRALLAADVRRFGKGALGVLCLLALAGILIMAGGVGLPLVILAGLFLLGRLIAGIGGDHRQGHRQAGGRPATPRPPGILSSFAGWLSWQLPFSSLRRQVSSRVSRIQSLVAQGAIDEALRLGLRLGSDGNGKRLPRRYPAQLPGARARLDFDLAPATFFSPILDGEQDWRLRGCYVQLCEQLERSGDHRRAAFIQSQLLGNHVEAALLLERGGLLDEAAQLALAARLPGPLCVRLLHAAGHEDDALALARRSGCFEELARDSRDGPEEFHAYVIKAWTDALLASAQALRALQVTDDLAKRKDADPLLLGLRRQWLQDAMRSEASLGICAETLARVLLGGDLQDPEGLGASPGMTPSTADVLTREALSALENRVMAEDAADELLAFLSMLARLAERSSPEQARFWNGGAAAIIEALVVQLLRSASSALSGDDLSRVQHLARLAGLNVLATDIGKLTKLFRASDQPSRTCHWPAPQGSQSRAVVGCLLANGAILAWRENETLDVFDRFGARIWSRRLEGVTALVPLGRANEALIVQRQRTGQALVSRMTMHDGQIHPIGQLDLLAHHDVTSESGWMVQVGGEFGALDISALRRKRPGFEFLWSCSLTQRVRALAFLQGPGSQSWITVDLSPDRSGVTELWKCDGGSKLDAYLCNPQAITSRTAPIPSTTWAWATDQHGVRAHATAGGASMSCLPWSEPSEARARAIAHERGEMASNDEHIPCDLDRSLVLRCLPPDLADGQCALQIRGKLQDSAALFTIAFAEDARVTCLHRAPAPSDTSGGAKPAPGVACGKVLLADANGRLAVVEPLLARVTLI